MTTTTTRRTNAADAEPISPLADAQRELSALEAKHASLPTRIADTVDAADAS